MKDTNNINNALEVLNKGIKEALEAHPETSGFPPLPGYGYGSNSYRDDGTALRNYLRAVRKRLWLIVSLVVLVTSLTLLYVARQPDIYEARVRIQIDSENANPTRGISKNSPIIFSNPLQELTYMNTQIDNLTSPGLLRRVVKTLDLEHNESFIRSKALQNRSTWQSLRRMFGFGGKPVEEQQEVATNDPLIPGSVAPAVAQEDLEEAKRLEPYVRMIAGRLNVKKVPDTRIITISYSHYEPRISAKVVNAVADTFVYTNIEKRNETNTSAGAFLQKRIADLQTQIRRDEERLQNYAKSHQILSLDENQNTVVERLVLLNRQLLEAENERKLAEAAYRAAQAPGATEALSEESATASKQIADLESKLTELKTKEAQLLEEYTPKYPEVQAVQQQIKVLEKQIQDIRNRAKNVTKTNLETRYKQALAREQALRDEFNKQRGQTLTQNEAAINYRIIQQEIATNKNLLDGMLQRAKENDAELAGSYNNIHVNEYAVEPSSPSGPRRLFYAIIAFFIALISGTFLAIFLDYLDDSIRSAEDVERYLRLPVLGAIPSAGKSKQRRLLPSSTALKRVSKNDRANSIVKNEVRSTLVEAYHHLRTSLMLAMPDGAPKTMLITSSVPAEGKTTTTINTAIRLAKTGANVLVIDADMRRPCIHTVFNMDNKNGLSTILASKMNETEMLNIIEKDEETGVYILPAGPVPPNPADLVVSNQMHRLLGIMEKSFTHVIIDSPPIASFTDGVLISTLVDGVLLVVHSGKSSRNIVRRSRQMLTDAKAKVFGVVLNNVELQKHDYYYYQSYYHKYYNGSSNNEPQQY